MSHDEQNNRPQEEWVAKLRYSRSFLAKLILSEYVVKEYYAALATKLLSYDKVRWHQGWGGDLFAAGRKTVARIAFGGKTLVLYLALDPTQYEGGKYHLAEANAKRYAAMGKLRITSARALAYALRLVEDLAAAHGLVLRATPLAPVSAGDFPPDSVDNLLARGLIRLVRVRADEDDTDTAWDEGAIAAEAVAVAEADGIDRAATMGPESCHDAMDPAAYPAEESAADVPAAEESTTTVSAAEGEETAPTHGALGSTETAESEAQGEDNAALLAEGEAYRDTLAQAQGLMTRHTPYADLLTALEEAAPQVRLTKRILSTPLDEAWVRAIEDCAQALDEVTRNPAHYIEETEELLPIERTKKVTQRSIQHLSQHTGLISRIEGDTIIPSKLLNIFRDDSIMTYENKFVNTLLSRLYDFVAIRYEAAQEGADKEAVALDCEGQLATDNTSATIEVRIRLQSPATGEGKNYALQSDLWRRAQKVYEMVCDYQQCEFVRQMGNAYIRPPVMHTNAILKNKMLRRCLELWEFIESYEDGEGTVADEQPLEIPEDYMAHLYRSVAAQYLTFCHNARAPRALRRATAVSAAPIAPPSCGADGAPRAGEDAPDATDETLWAIEVALAADAVLTESTREEREALAAARQRLQQEAREEDIPAPEAPQSAVDDTPVVMPDAPVPVAWAEDTHEEEAPIETDQEEQVAERTEVVRVHADGQAYREVTTYRKSLQAKLQLADDSVKARFVGIYNRFVSRDKVHPRTSYDYVTFSVGGRPLARMTIIGKTLRVYYALDPATVDAKYNTHDASAIKKYNATPTLLYVRGNRSYAYALELVDVVCDGLQEAVNPVYARVDDYPVADMATLLARGLVQRTVANIPMGQSPFVTRNAAPLVLQRTTPDADYSEDYRQAAQRLKGGRKGPQRTLSLDGIVGAGEVLEVLQRTDDDFRREREADMAAHPAPAAPLDEGGGDALVMRREAMVRVRTAAPEASQPEAPAAPTPPPAPVPMGGDALTPKPITADDIDNLDAAPSHEAVPTDQPRRAGRFWRRKKRK